MSDRLSTINYVQLHLRNINILNVKPLLVESTSYAHAILKKSINYTSLCCHFNL